MIRCFTRKALIKSAQFSEVYCTHINRWEFLTLTPHRLMKYLLRHWPDPIVEDVGLKGMCKSRTNKADKGAP